MNRRVAVGGILGGTVGSFMGLASEPAGGAGAMPSGGRAGQHRPTPLPFDPKKLDGLSERLIVSHHENNYGGAIRNLNRVEEELARVTAETPAFVLGGLKERELAFTNSVVLHELYFGNLGGHGPAGGPIGKALSETGEGLARWEEMFRATGMSLAGGSGWTILDLHIPTGELRTYWSGNHTQAPAWGYPLLVMDLYEHAYQMDYGASASRYIDAFFRNVNWDVVNQRLEKARAAVGLHTT